MGLAARPGNATLAMVERRRQRRRQGAASRPSPLAGMEQGMAIFPLPLLCKVNYTCLASDRLYIRRGLYMGSGRHSQQTSRVAKAGMHASSAALHNFHMGKPLLHGSHQPSPLPRMLLWITLVEQLQEVQAGQHGQQRCQLRLLPHRHSCQIKCFQASHARQGGAQQGRAGRSPAAPCCNSGQIFRCWETILPLMTGPKRRCGWLTRQG